MHTRILVIIPLIFVLAQNASASKNSLSSQYIRALVNIREKYLNNRSRSLERLERSQFSIVKNILDMSPKDISFSEQEGLAVAFLTSSPISNKDISFHNIEFKNLLHRILSYKDDDGKRTTEKIENYIASPFVLSLRKFLQAKHMMEDNAILADNFLDIARLGTPGSYIEETILRQQILLLIKIENYEKAIYLLKRYYRKYQNSSHASSFLEFLEHALLKEASHLSKDDKIERLQVLSSAFKFLDTDTLFKLMFNLSISGYLDIIQRILDNVKQRNIRERYSTDKVVLYTKYIQAFDFHILDISSHIPYGLSNEENVLLLLIDNINLNFRRFISKNASSYVMQEGTNENWRDSNDFIKMVRNRIPTF